MAKDKTPKKDLKSIVKRVGQKKLKSSNIKRKSQKGTGPRAKK